MVFIPLPFDETLWGGEWHKLRIAKVERLGSALARRTGHKESEALSDVVQRLAALLAKDTTLLNQVPDKEKEYFLIIKFSL